MLDISAQAKIHLMPQDTEVDECIDRYVADCRKHDFDPRSGDVFVFLDVEAIKLGLLSYDGSGYQLCIKRLSRGHFTWPVEDAVINIDIETLRLLYQGADIKELIPEQGLS